MFGLFGTVVLQLEEPALLEVGKLPVRVKPSSSLLKAVKERPWVYAPGSQ